MFFANVLVRKSSVAILFLESFQKWSEKPARFIGTIALNLEGGANGSLEIWSIESVKFIYTSYLFIAFIAFSIYCH